MNIISCYAGSKGLEFALWQFESKVLRRDKENEEEKE